MPAAAQLVILPLQAGGRTMGLVELYSFSEPRHLDASEMHAAQAMASLAATGLEKVRWSSSCVLPPTWIS